MWYYWGQIIAKVVSFLTDDTDATFFPYALILSAIHYFTNFLFSSASAAGSQYVPA